MPTVGVVLHPSRRDPELLARVVADARARDVALVARPGDARDLPEEVETVDDDAFAARVDGVLSLGGDGTMLGAMRLVAARPVPVLGVNTGHLGFLVEVQPTDLDDAVARLATGAFVVEEHSGLRASTPDGRERMAFNDVVIARDRAASVSADLHVGADRYGYYRCDAVVVATPHGSTAYNFAAGGPVVSPSAAVCVVTPVAPMSGISRSVVLSGTEVLRLTPVATGPDVPVEIDGTDGGRLPPGGTLTVEVVPGAGQVVRLDPAGHAARNRVTLSLQDLPLRRDQLLELVPEQLRPARPGERPSPA